MSSQREIWRDEHNTEETFTRIHSVTPSGPVPGFADLLEEEGFVPSNTQVLDIGCGKGRNSGFLSNKGFKVKGIDFAGNAIERANKRFPDVEFEVVDLSGKWPFGDESIAALIDCNTTICIPNPGRENAISEAHRVLKQGGYYLFYGVGPSPLLQKSPGPEPNSAIFPKTGKFEKQYTRDELIETYKDFKVVSLEEIQGSDIIEGEEIKYLMWIAVFQKSQ